MCVYICHSSPFQFYSVAFCQSWYVNLCYDASVSSIEIGNLCWLWWSLCIKREISTNGEKRCARIKMRSYICTLYLAVNFFFQWWIYMQFYCRWRWWAIMGFITCSNLFWYSGGQTEPLHRQVYKSNRFAKRMMSVLS